MRSISSGPPILTEDELEQLALAAVRIGARPFVIDPSRRRINWPIILELHHVSQLAFDRVAPRALAESFDLCTRRLATGTRAGRSVLGWSR